MALAELSEAYELLDEQQRRRLEEQLFGPVQTAYGRVRRAHARSPGATSCRGGRSRRPSPGAPGRGVKGFLDSAVTAIARGRPELATLQDSMLPVEIGDAELRADLEQVRELLGGLGRERARVRAHARTLSLALPAPLVDRLRRWR